MVLDILTEFYNALRRAGAAEKFHAQPPILVDRIVAHFETVVRACKRANIKLRCVFDELRHDGKARIDAQLKQRQGVLQSNLLTTYLDHPVCIPTNATDF